LKVFIDRSTDLITIEKDLGRKLKNKHVSFISTGSEDKPRDCFSKPIELTAQYLQMKYKGNFYCSIQNKLNTQELNAFVNKMIESFI